MENGPVLLKLNDKRLASDLVAAPAVSVSSSAQDHNSCRECKIKFESQVSLQVHLQYHRDSLLTKWTCEGKPVGLPSPSCKPESPSLTTVSVSGSGCEESEAVAVSSKSAGPGPASSMQISMAQSMGIQQGAPPHLHHTTNILLSSEGGQENPSTTSSLPSINADVSDFFTQLENSADSSTVLTINSLSNSVDKGNRFHPYERPVFSTPSSNAMNGAPAVQSYLSYTPSFNDAGLYQNTDYLNVSAGDGMPYDQTGEDIWDMDSNTVRRYNPGPDPVSPGPIPTTPTMYGQQQHHQVQTKPGWEPNSLYPQYGALNRGQTPQSMPPQPISPGIGGPWIGGSLPVKGQSVVESKRPKSYQCEACDKWFTSSGHLKRHFNTTLHKNAMKQKGDTYIDGLNGGAFSIPSVESRGAPSPCMSLGEDSSQSSVCDELSSQSTQSSQLSLPPVSTPGPVPSIITLNPPTSLTESCSPNSNTSCNVPNVSPSQQMLSPPPSSHGIPDSASSPLSGLTQMVGVAPSTPIPSHSPLTPSSGISLSPNGNLNGSPAHKNRFSPFRAGPPSTISYKVQSIDQRSYPSYPTTFQSLPSSQSMPSHNYNNDMYMSNQSSYPVTGYTGQYQYQPIYSSYDMSGSQAPFLNHTTYTDISGYAPVNGEGVHVFHENVRTLKLDERDSPEGSENSEASIKTETGEFRCNECNKLFNKMCYLKQHNKSFHNGEKPFKCTQCGKRFPVEVLYQVNNLFIIFLVLCTV